MEKSIKFLQWTVISRFSEDCHILFSALLTKFHTRDGSLHRHFFPNQRRLPVSQASQPDFVSPYPKDVLVAASVANAVEMLGAREETVNLFRAWLLWYPGVGAWIPDTVNYCPKVIPQFSQNSPKILPK